MPSRARIAGKRIGGTIRQNPEADVTELRGDVAAGHVADVAEDWVETWSPTPEQVDVVARILDTADTAVTARPRASR